MKELLKLNNVMYQLPTGEELWEIKNLSVHMGDKIGLIGKNGSGKTSLFDCIVGVKDFSGGSHSVTPNLFYIPQQKDKNLDDLSVQELLDTHKINTAAFLSVTTKEFEFSSDFINKKINTLSGGEYVKLYITIASLKKPALLLLDEPTNHLDTDGINFLVNWLKMFNGAFICISHDTDFLNRTIKSIWEIENAKINVFGGNYFKYKEIKDLERQSILRKIEVKEKEIKKVKKSVQIEQARQQRSIREGNVQKFDRSMEKAAIGYFKEQAQKSASKNTNRLSGLLEDKENELSELSLNKTQKIRLKINGEGEGYTIFNIENTNLYLGNIIFIQDINIKVVSGDRIESWVLSTIHIQV
jgi:ATPase subunit of ABC transporter with duplicated ATPase domains